METEDKAPVSSLMPMTPPQLDSSDESMDSFPPLLSFSDILNEIVDATMDLSTKMGLVSQHSDEGITAMKDVLRSVAPDLAEQVLQTMSISFGQKKPSCTIEEADDESSDTVSDTVSDPD
jgi:hypothetical protein